MAQVFGTPEDLPDAPDWSDPKRPEFRSGKYGYNLEAILAAEDKWLNELIEWCRTHSDSKSELIGEEIRFPMADGYARYLVWRTKPLSLIHIPLGDAWNLPDYQLRGLRVSDVREIVRRQRGLSELFSKDKDSDKGS